ncbi:HAD-like domain-containing protein [Cladochytrium replicatum]|nr:HAD-like domain-containing protein [Cladochytrium replicatum]
MKVEAELPLRFECEIDGSSDVEAVFDSFFSKESKVYAISVHGANGGIHIDITLSSPSPKISKFERKGSPPRIEDEPTHVVTLIGSSSPPWSSIIAALVYLEISVVKLKHLGSSAFELGVILPDEVEESKLHNSLHEFSKKHPGIDATLQSENVFRKAKRLVVFDMDSTLIEQEVIDEIAKFSGVVDQVAKITESAMNGEIDFSESLRRRVGLLKGTPSNVLDRVREIIRFKPGVVDLCKALKRLGIKMAVISGGFIPLALYVKATLGLDYAFANQLKVSADGSVLEGETIGSIVDGRRKAELLDVIAQAEGIHDRRQIMAVGDGANDLLMLGRAGLGIAYNAKPKVQQQAKARINQPSLLNSLHLLGYTEAEIQQLLQ